MRQRTRGPWTIHRDPTELRLCAIKGWCEYEPREFASVWVAREVSKADSQLVAAAPDLLEACEKALPFLELSAAASVPGVGTIVYLVKSVIAKTTKK